LFPKEKPNTEGEDMTKTSFVAALILAAAVPALAQEAAAPAPAKADAAVRPPRIAVIDMGPDGRFENANRPFW
jgi:hypothetical protein